MEVQETKDLNSYTFEYWFRYGEFEKDFEIVTIASNTLEEAIEKVKNIRRWIFSIKLVTQN